MFYPVNRGYPIPSRISSLSGMNITGCGENEVVDRNMCLPIN